MASENVLIEKLQDLQRQLGKRQTFEGAVSSLKSLLQAHYSSSSPSTCKLFYTIICRVGTVLRTRYTALGYLRSGLELFQIAEGLATDSAEKKHLNSLISNILSELEEPEEGQTNQNVNRGRARGYLFEGHLTVDPEPPQPAWLVHQNLLTTLAAQAESSDHNRMAEEIDNVVNSESMGTMLRGLVESLEDSVTEALDDPTATTGRRRPPASKDAVAKLPIIKLDEEVLRKFGEETECAICKEKLVMGDEMQELPCKHTFHPPCLKPWFDEHNSCPNCRHELPTDDHDYESWKEREKELEEERRGAANAVRGGEFMYV